MLRKMISRQIAMKISFNCFKYEVPKRIIVANTPPYQIIDTFSLLGCPKQRVAFPM